MKRIVLIFILIFVFSLIGCSYTKGNENDISKKPFDTTNQVPKQPIDTAKEIESIIDNSNGMELPDVEEHFYEDDSHIYGFGNPISEYVIVKYTDGTTENVKEALKNGRIQITDLDKHGVNYFAEPKLIKNIVDLTERDKLLTADVLEGVYQDDIYCYGFGSLKSQYVIVYYKDGTEQNVRDALAEGKIKITDLDWFGIGYWKEPRLYITDIIDRDTMDTAIDVFFTGMEYYYYFPSIHETTVYYSDGTEQSLKEAMSDLRVTIEDLDRFGITYLKALLKD